MLNHPQALIPTVLLVAAAGVLSAAAPARAQSADATGLRADMIADISSMESKFVSLAEAMPAAAYDWSPMEGVRSVGEVFCHMSAANFGIPRFSICCASSTIRLYAICSSVIQTRSIVLPRSHSSLSGNGPTSSICEITKSICFTGLL